MDDIVSTKRPRGQFDINNAEREPKRLRLLQSPPIWYGHALPLPLPDAAISSTSVR